ncbi:alpha/beta fold hydrolase (plasmid) [Rhizobium leguminosarum]|uniref:alpha/beta fold hydrolase n=2 Tax=Rhizobium/Agrobacterium group TaxID=227290 RepID=UPI000376C09E|nr:alpha/beta fold hydrolase [Rhizobium leguminosarum]NKK03599.1 alpha/beta fold hydrolase [Rhizobium leguminosarum bv. viciae]QIO75503.1 alpha/beta fold hydrolase [Rhizobium leguminosarum bv. trifolii]MBY5464080.1 alpha/beta fold hydrolase [Rhizobium leguminosarum]MBY5903316.1 alpha/beta fold hydrolase [Rhizobium leguminosarum]MBY5910359.1 alpha/beta fold hydrolase [Rhizobium leguminosarum]
MRLMLVKSVQPTFGITIHVADQDVHILGGGNSHGIPVVLLHGCGSLAQEILLPFDNSDIRIIAPDRPGYGLSTPAAPAERGPEGQPFWLERLLTSLDLSEVRIVAHSIGSAAALHLAARRPEVSGICPIMWSQALRERCFVILWRHSHKKRNCRV